MRIKDFYSKIKNIIRNNPDYELVDDGCYPLIDYEIDDDTKSVILIFGEDKH